MNKKILFSWVGVFDFKVFSGKSSSSENGALLSIACESKADEIVLLWADAERTPLEQTDKYVEWLSGELAKKGLSPKIHIHPYTDSADRVMDFAWINGCVEKAFSFRDLDGDIMVNATSGTPMMLAVWIVRAKSKISGDMELYLSNREKGVEKAVFPKGLEIGLHLEALGGSDKSYLERLLGSTEYEPSNSFDSLLAKSIEMKAVIYRAESVAPFHNHCVLIQGPPGVGKSLLAKSIHMRSARKNKPFKEIDCGTLNDSGAISELWGWKRGSFTGATGDNPGIIGEANGGTIFLDEIGNAPHEVQRSLLRLLQTKRIRKRGDTEESKVDIRIIAATNLDLKKATREGIFRQDLLDRISALTIDIPPLRDRPEDIFPIAQKYLDEFNKSYESELSRIGKLRYLGSRTEKALKSYAWPGNVRELQHFIARLVIFGNHRTEEITDKEIYEEIHVKEIAADNILGREIGGNFSLEGLLREVEFNYVKRALDFSGGKHLGAGEALGLTRPKFGRITKNLNKAGYKL